MLKKLHWKLTAICTVITSIIVILMMIFSLFISEASLRQKEYASFSNYVNSIYSHLEIEKTITLDWVRNTQKNGLYLLSIIDNGNPIRLSESDEPNSSILITMANKVAAEKYNFDPNDHKPSQVLPKHIEFSFHHKGLEYYASSVYIPKEHGAISSTIVYSLAPFHHSILIQRLIYIGVSVLAILSLFIFSYFFTRKTIRPVEEGQAKQERFIAAASHELRSPLTVIRTSLSAMKKADTVKAQRFESIIQSEIDRMSRLISDMLLLSGTGEHSWPLLETAVDINQLLSDVYDSYQELARQKNLSLHLKTDAARKLTAYCDRQRMEQVLFILLNNAISYTPEGGSITLSSKLKGRKCILSVADNGMGIPDENKAQIFERFYRIDSSHKSKEHFGLGLCIAGEIVKLHHGTIEVVDTPGGGATFLVILNM